MWLLVLIILSHLIPTSYFMVIFLLYGNEFHFCNPVFCLKSWFNLEVITVFSAFPGRFVSLELIGKRWSHLFQTLCFCWVWCEFFLYFTLTFRFCLYSLLVLIAGCVFPSHADFSDSSLNLQGINCPWFSSLDLNMKIPQTSVWVKFFWSF